MKNDYSLKIKVYKENEIANSLNTSKIITDRNNDKNNSDLNSIKEVKKVLIPKSNNKKIKYKLKIDNNKMPLRKDYQSEIDLKKNDINIKKINKNKMYDNKEIYYKFPGLPICGYKGYIPQMKYFCGISNSKIINIVFKNGLYLKDLEIKSEINNDKVRKKNIEKIIIYCEDRPLTKRDTKKIIKKRQIISINNKDNINSISYEENKKKGKKSLYKIGKEYKEIENIFLNNTFKKIIQNSFYKNNENINLYNPNFIYICPYFNIKNYFFDYFYRKKYFINKKEEFPNIFDSIFSIRKIGYNIELIQHDHDFSELIKPYLEEEKFKLLINYSFPTKTKNDLPENWKKHLSLTNIYPIFGLDKILEDNTKNDEDVGMIKLHKGY